MTTIDTSPFVVNIYFDTVILFLISLQKMLIKDFFCCIEVFNLNSSTISSYSFI